MEMNEVYGLVGFQQTGFLRLKYIAFVFSVCSVYFHFVDGIFSYWYY